MPRNARKQNNTSFFHVMLQGINKEYIFEKDIFKNQYIKFMNKEKESNNIKIISYCIMNNHLHLLVKTETTEQLSKFMQKINTIYAMYYNNVNHRVGYVFRDRYKSQIIYSESQLYTCINYIHNNPVKAGICNNASEYSYSSFNEYIQNVDKYKEFIGKFELDKKVNIKEQKLIFLEDEEDKEKEVQCTVNKFLLEKNIELFDIKDNDEILMLLFRLLKDNYDFSLRKIARYLGMGRETLRLKIKKQ